MRGGYHDEALAWRDWLLRAVAGDVVASSRSCTGPPASAGSRSGRSTWLPGYEGSEPVRIGNAASGQYQLDVYGEVMSALYASAAGRGSCTAGPAWDLQTQLIEFLETGGSEPDDGIWEVRGPRRHFTHSKVMAWVAVDRAVRDARGVVRPRGPARQVARAARRDLHDEVCDKGYNAGRRRLHAVLRLGRARRQRAHDPPRRLPARRPTRGWSSTVEAIERELMDDGFVLRYRTDDDGDVDGLTGREGAFLACSFWLVDCLHLIGRARRRRRSSSSGCWPCATTSGLLVRGVRPLAGPAGRQLPPGLLPRVADQLGLPAQRGRPARPGRRRRPPGGRQHAAATPQPDQERLGAAGRCRTRRRTRTAPTAVSGTHAHGGQRAPPCRRGPARARSRERRRRPCRAAAAAHRRGRARDRHPARAAGSGSRRAT